MRISDWSSDVCSSDLLGGWEDGVGSEESVWVLLADLGHQESSHTRSSTASEGVGELEALQAINSLSLTANTLKNSLDELSALGVEIGRPAGRERVCEYV